MNFIDFVEQVLKEAAEIAVSKQASITEQTVKAGDNNQVLTEADLAIGKLIVEKIQEAFPSHSIIDEEAGVIDNHSSVTWVVDPIDGTSNYAEGLPTYGILVGVLENDVPVAGGISLPAFNKLYLGGKQQKATCNGKEITVSTKQDLLNSLVAYGIDGHQENPAQTKDEVATLGEIILGIRNLRTTNSAYDMAMTVEGKYGVYLNKTTKIWDNIAVQAVIEAAGGICTDFYGKPIDYSEHLQKVDDNFTICAGSPDLHKQIQEIIHDSK